MKKDEIAISVTAFNETWTVFAYLDVLKDDYVMANIYLDDHKVTHLLKLEYIQRIHDYARQAIKVSQD